MDFKSEYAKKGYVSAGMMQEYTKDYSRQQILSPLQEYENLKKFNDDLQKNWRKNHRGEVIKDSAEMQAVKRAMNRITEFYAQPMSMKSRDMAEQLDVLSSRYSVLIFCCNNYLKRLFISHNSRYHLVEEIRLNAISELHQLKGTAYGLFNRALVQQSNMDITTNIITTENKEVINNDQNVDCPVWANVLEVMHTRNIDLTDNDNITFEEKKDTEHPVSKITVKNQPGSDILNIGNSKGLIFENVKLSNSHRYLKESITEYLKKGANKNVIANDHLEEYLELSDFFLTRLLDPSKYSAEYDIWDRNGGDGQEYPEEPRNKDPKQYQQYRKNTQEIEQRDRYIKVQRYLIEILSKDKKEGTDVKDLLQTAFWENDDTFKANFIMDCTYFLDSGYPAEEFNDKKEILRSKEFQNVMWEYFSEYYKRKKRNRKLAKDVGLNGKENLTRRNVAAYHLAKLFGIGNLVTPATNVKYKDSQQKEHFGVLIPQPTGINMEEYEKQNGSKPIISPGCLLQLNTLQIFDLICGMKDRPMNDILLNISPKTNQAIGIQSIHNEASFGNLPLENNQNQDSGKLILGNNIKIAYIDRNFYDRLKSINGGMISSRLAGLIEPEYMNSLVIRFDLIKKAITEAVEKSKSKILVYPSDLNKREDVDPKDDTVTFKDQENSYVNKILNDTHKSNQIKDSENQIENPIVEQNQNQINIHEKDQNQNQINIHEEGREKEAPIAKQQNKEILQDASDNEDLEEEDPFKNIDVEGLKTLARKSYAEVVACIKGTQLAHLLEPCDTRKFKRPSFTLDDCEDLMRIINEACKAHYKLISMDLKGEVTLEGEERAELDERMQKLFYALTHPGGVDKDQSNIMTTKFFNAIGWSSHKPRICKNIETEISKLPNRVKMFHSINCAGSLDIGKMVAQIMGKGRQYYSFGVYGQGIYTAARKLEATSDIEKKDNCASKHSWLYADSINSVQFTFTLNEYAKVIEAKEIPAKLAEIRAKYPRAFDKRNFVADIPPKYGSKSDGVPYGVSMIMAFLGYNTIRIKEPDIKEDPGEIEYYCTTDRKALSTDAMLEYLSRDRSYEHKEVMKYNPV